MNKEIEKETLETDTDTELEDDTELEESADTDEETGDEDEDEFTPLSVEDQKKLIASRNRIFARAKKAEGFKLVDGSWVKDETRTSVVAKPKTNTSKTTKEEVLTRDEIRLINEGYDDNSINKIKAYAKAMGITIQEALKDDLVVSWKKGVDANLKKKKASLKTSEGSQTFTPAKEVKDMSRKEHEALVKEIFG